METTTQQQGKQEDIQTLGYLPNVCSCFRTVLTTQGEKCIDCGKTTKTKKELDAMFNDQDQEYIHQCEGLPKPSYFLGWTKPQQEELRIYSLYATKYKKPEKQEPIRIETLTDCVLMEGKYFYLRMSLPAFAKFQEANKKQQIKTLLESTKPDQYIKVSELCDLLKTTPKTIYNYCLEISQSDRIGERPIVKSKVRWYIYLWNVLFFAKKRPRQHKPIYIH